MPRGSVAHVVSRRPVRPGGPSKHIAVSCRRVPHIVSRGCRRTYRLTKLVAMCSDRVSQIVRRGGITFFPILHWSEKQLHLP